MKATGVVWRVDDLGRIVIPKEIRRTMRIREGEPMEIFTDGGGSVIFRKYSPMGELSEVASRIADALHRETDKACVICDRDGIVAASGIRADGQSLCQEAEKAMEQRRLLTHDECPSELWRGGPVPELIAPVISGGDLSGCVILLEGKKELDPEEVRLARMTASFMARQMEN